MPEKCHVINCNHPVVAKGLCQMHYKRIKRHGDIERTRPNDWGQREKHPAYRAWCGLRRYHKLDMSENWKEDFWEFVKETPEKPANSKAMRPDSTKPWSKDNFYWKVNRVSSEDRKAYMREWQRKARLVNYEYFADKDLQKKYGVNLEWYKETLFKQKNVCAICKQPEKAVIRNKVIAMPVDHDHNTGKARGLLCTKCNRGLGLFCDNKEILQSAIEYLNKQ